MISESIGILVLLFSTNHFNSTRNQNESEGWFLMIFTSGSTMKSKINWRSARCKFSSFMRCIKRPFFERNQMFCLFKELQKTIETIKLRQESVRTYLVSNDFLAKKWEIMCSASKRIKGTHDGQQQKSYDRQYFFLFFFSLRIRGFSQYLISLPSIFKAIEHL